MKELNIFLSELSFFVACYDQLSRRNSDLGTCMLTWAYNGTHGNLHSSCSRMTIMASGKSCFYTLFYKSWRGYTSVGVILDLE